MKIDLGQQFGQLTNFQVDRENRTAFVEIIRGNQLAFVVCRCKVHRRCLPSASVIACKWTTLASVADDIIHAYDNDDDDEYDRVSVQLCIAVYKMHCW